MPSRPRWTASSPASRSSSIRSPRLCRSNRSRPAPARSASAGPFATTISTRPCLGPSCWNIGCPAAVTWQFVPIAPGTTQAYWNPKANTLVEVRLKARDRAGNVGEGLTTVSLAGAAQGLPPPAPDAFPPPANPPQDGDLQKLGAKERRFVNTKRVVLNCELKEFGPSGVSLVELWYTHDARSWSRGPEFKVPPGEEQGKQAITFDVATEGVYGLTLLARSGVGLGDRPPQVGDRPQLWIEVDTTKPAVKVLAVVVGNGADKGKLTVNWSAFDKNPTPMPITLSYAEKADGPWKAFAEKLPNNGRYVWSMPTEGIPYQFLVKVEAADLAGNVGEAITPDLDQGRPVHTQGADSQCRTVRQIRASVKA